MRMKHSSEDAFRGKFSQTALIPSWNLYVSRDVYHEARQCAHLPTMYTIKAPLELCMTESVLTTTRYIKVFTHRATKPPFGMGLEHTDSG